jgi:arylsulfatase A-like enzyme
MMRTRPLLRTLLLFSLVAFAQLEGRAGQPQTSQPNILFIILDDVGKDQLVSFNPAATTGPMTPNLNAIAAAGVRFTNFYTMPECSPSRVAFFTGRYPLRTGVEAAVLDQDLPASQVSPFEVTTPKVLAAAGYTSAMFGKYHLGGPENNPDGNNAPIALGWHYFDGNLRGAPAPIDVTLGGQYTKDTQKYSCGFPTGSERQACWFQVSATQSRCDDNLSAGYTGQQAVALGGIPALDAQGNLARTCRDAASAGPDFTRFNGYYVWPQAAGDASSGMQLGRSRRYMTAAQTDAAIAWIRKQSQTSTPRPWMATVSYNAIHTPYQQPPLDLYPPGFTWPANVPESCSNSNTAGQRIISGLMLAAIDQEIGRLLVATGLAFRGDRGQLLYRPEYNDTMVVIVGDNGTYLTSVKPPYDPLRSKGTVYQTGVSAPLIVSGPGVSDKGRSVDHPVNAVDLFKLFAEIPQPPIDLSVVVPLSHALDSERMMAYLTNPNQANLRRFNFTEAGPAVRPASSGRWPCIVKVGTNNIAVDIFTNESVCADNNGEWFGPTAGQPNPPYPTTCAVRASGIYANLTILPTRVRAIRIGQYKLVQAERAPCDSNLGEFELYDLSVLSAANPLGLDLSTADLLTNGRPVGLTSAQLAAYNELRFELQTLVDSEHVCTGDGNLDKRVDQADLDGVRRYMGLPSVFDFNQDGVTDDRDFAVVLSNFGRDCR